MKLLLKTLLTRFIGDLVSKVKTLHLLFSNNYASLVEEGVPRKICLTFNQRLTIYFRNLIAFEGYLGRK